MLNIMDSGLRTQDSGLRTQGELCSDIDFVIPWVDGSDPQWQQLRALYSEDERKATGNNGEVRYRDWGILHFWFRATEKYAPWVRKIHFITSGQLPEWLNLNHPKLNFVKHQDYIPTQYLPTFSANPIELNIFRIKGLSEKFVYFNDDMFLNAPVKPQDFFVNSLPCASAILSPGPSDMGLGGVTSVTMTDILLINKHFDFVSRFKADCRKWLSPRYGIKYLLKTLLLLPFKRYTGFTEFHTAHSYLKSTFKLVWEKEPEVLERTCKHRFRDFSDVNQWLMEYWQLASGTFFPRSPKFSRTYSSKLEEQNQLLDDIKHHRTKIICINDGLVISKEAFETYTQKIQEAFSEVLPEKSEFEI